MRSSRRSYRDVLVVAGLCLATLTSCVSARRSLSQSEVPVAEVALRQDGDAFALDVTVTVPGDVARDVVGVRMSMWGGVEREQLSDATVDGGATVVGEDGVIRLGPATSGAPRVVRFRLPVHPERTPEMRLAPRRAEDGVVLFSRGVIPSLVLAGERDRPIDVMGLVPAQGFEVVATLVAAPCPAGVCSRIPENGVVAFVPNSSPHLPLLASGTARILDLSGLGFGQAIGALVDRIVETRPLQPDPPIVSETRLIVVERSPEEGVTYGTWTEAGMRIGLSEFSELRDGHRQIITHELLHESVNPDRLGADAPLWMYEGFTEYLAVWTRAAMGDITPAQFADRMRGHEVRALTALERHGARFGERDDAARRNTADEWVAYSGGTLYAFALDVALRACGADLGVVLADASKRKSGSTGAVAAFRDALAARGLGAMHDSLVGAGKLPRLAPTLAAAGFVFRRVEASLTYLGFALEGERSLFSSEPRVVTAVDPEGPAAAAGLQRGDSIVEVETDERGDPPKLGDAVDRRYGAGLAEVATGAMSVKLRVRRGAEVLDVEMKPSRVSGGYRDMARVPEGGISFFGKPVAGASCR